MRTIFQIKNKSTFKLNVKAVILGLIILLFTFDKFKGISEYSFNPLKYYDDKYEAFYVIQTRAQTLGANLFFEKAETKLTNFMQENIVFEVPQPILDSPFEPYYKNYGSLISLNSNLDSVNSGIEDLKNHPEKKAFLKQHGMDFENLKFRHKTNKREYNVQQILESKRMNDLYDFVHHFESKDFQNRLDREKAWFTQNSGIKEALHYMTTDAYKNLTYEEANPIKILNKQVSSNDGLYKEKYLKFMFKPGKGINKIDMIYAITDDPQVTSVHCYNRRMERFAKYHKCKKKKSMITSFMFKMKNEEQEGNSDDCLAYLHSEIERNQVENIPKEWLHLRRFKLKMCNEDYRRFGFNHPTSLYLKFRIIPKKLIIVTISEKINFKDTKLNFELLFLNKTSIMTPYNSFDNYLFIRNLNSEKKRVDERSSKSCIPSEKDKNNNSNNVCKEEPVNPAKLDIEISNFTLGNHFNLLNFPSAFKDPTLFSQKIPKELRTRIFKKVMKGNMTERKNYNFKFEKKSKEQKAYWTLKPNELRPIAEVTNRNSDHFNCKPQEMNFPYFNNYLSICSIMNDDPQVCHLRRHNEKIDTFKYCDLKRAEIENNFFKWESLPRNLEHPIIYSLYEVLALIVKYCNIFSKKSENLYDNFKDSYKFYQDCYSDYTVDDVTKEKIYIKNTVNDECYTLGNNHYINSETYCSKVESIFRNELLRGERVDKCDVKKFKHIQQNETKDRINVTQTFKKSFEKIMAREFKDFIPDDMRYISIVFMRRKTHFHELNDKLLELKRGSENIDFKKWKEKFDQLFSLLDLAKKKYIAHNEEKVINVTSDSYCRLVKASRSVDYILFFKKFKISNINFCFVKEFIRYIYFGVVKFSIFPHKRENQKILGFDIFRNKNMEYLSESLFFILLSKLRKFTLESFKSFPLIFMMSNKKYFKKKIFERLFEKDLDFNKYVVKKSSFDLIDHCNEYSMNPKFYSYFWIRNFNKTSLRCDSYKLYQSFAEFVPKYRAKQFRMFFIKLLTKFFDKKDLNNCIYFEKHQEESFVVPQEVKLTVNSSKYEYSFPLILRRDKLIFDHNYLDLGVMSHTNTYHSGNVYISNKSNVPLIIRKLYIYNSNPKASVKFASSYRENLLLPFQKERVLLCKIIVGFKEEAEVEFEEISGYLEAEILAEGFNDLIREKLFFKAKFSKNFLDFGPKNKISIKNDGKNIEIINSNLDDYKRFTINLLNKSNFPLYIENFQLIEKYNAMNFYEFSAVNYDLLNDSNNSLLKRSKEKNIKCNEKNGIELIIRMF